MSQCIKVHHGNQREPDNAILYLGTKLCALGTPVAAGGAAIMVGDSNQDGARLLQRLLLHRYC